jgi:hypothetical protein
MKEDHNIHCTYFCWSLISWVTLLLCSIFSGTLSTHQKKLQEAKFEIITSEASYINSLNVLEKHFISSLEACDECVLSKNDRRTLFSNLIPGNHIQCMSLHFIKF